MQKQNIENSVDQSQSNTLDVDQIEMVAMELTELEVKRVEKEVSGSNAGVSQKNTMMSSNELQDTQEEDTSKIDLPYVLMENNPNEASQRINRVK